MLCIGGVEKNSLHVAHACSFRARTCAMAGGLLAARQTVAFATLEFQSNRYLLAGDRFVASERTTTSTTVPLAVTDRCLSDCCKLTSATDVADAVLRWR